MFILDSILIGSLRFVLDKIVAAAEAEAFDDSALREQLLEAQMRLELGEISSTRFRRAGLLESPPLLARSTILFVAATGARRNLGHRDSFRRWSSCRTRAS